MNCRRLLIILLFTPITGIFLFSFVTGPVAIVLALLFDMEPSEDNVLLMIFMIVVPAFIGAFFLNRAIYDSVSKSASRTQEGSVQTSPNLIGKSMLYGAIGSIAPYFLALLLGILINAWDPESASDISEVVGLLGTLACLPTILIGAILGGLFVWFVVRFEKPNRLHLKIQNSTDSRWLFLIGFIGGFLATPILGMFAAIVIMLTGTPLK